MEVAIRQGYDVNSSEEVRVKELKELEFKKVIRLKLEEWQICSKCGAPTRIDTTFRKELSSRCSGCGKTIQLSKNRETHYVIDAVNYNTIANICEKRISEIIAKEYYNYDSENRTWICHYKGETIPIFITQFSSYNSYVVGQDADNWLCIILDKESLVDNINYYNAFHFIKFEDLLYSAIDLRQRLNVLISSFKPNSSLLLNQKFDGFIGSISPSYFERQFVDLFLAMIKEEYDQLQTFLEFLFTRKNTIVNSKIILLGGPSNPDFVSIDLYEYLQECLKPDKIGEAKRYCSSRFTYDKFAVAESKANGADTAFIISTNNVQLEVWKKIIDTRQQTGYYKHTIIDKDLILLLITVLKLDNLLEKMKSPTLSGRVSSD